MVQYGRLLEDSKRASPPQWVEHWIDYRALKKLIYDIKGKGSCHNDDSNDDSEDAGRNSVEKAEPTSAAATMQKSRQFFERLRQEVNKISAFYNAKLKELQAKSNAFTDAMIEWRVQVEMTRPAPNVPDTSSKFQTCKGIYMDLLMLENFAVMNYGGVAKILKKHDKNAGMSTRVKYLNRVVNAKPFATMVVLKEIIRGAEHEMQRLVKLSQGIRKRNGQDPGSTESSSQDRQPASCFNDKEMIVLGLLKSFSKEGKNLENQPLLQSSAESSHAEDSPIVENYGSSSSCVETKRKLVETKTRVDKTKRRKN